MPDLPDATVEFHARTQRVVAASLLAARRIFTGFRASDIDGTFTRVAPNLLTVLAAGQLAAVQAAQTYVPRVLDEQNLDTTTDAEINPASFLGASSGVSLEDVLLSLPIRAKAQSGAGLADDVIEQRARALLEGIFETQIADAGRVAASVEMNTYPRVQWYVRMVEPGACSRCVVLAGRRYRMLTPFPRHDRCHCKHIPVDEDTADNYTTDPMRYFQSLTAEQQDHAFTKAGARAIRDGADISQVVNARRGALGLTPAGARITAEEARALRGGNAEAGHLQRTRVAGQMVYLTTEGTTKRGIAGKAMGNFEKTRAPGQRYARSSRARLMPESIYEIATDRDDALRLLRLYGYVT